MRTVFQLFLVTLAAYTSLEVSAENRQPSEAQCTQMINSMSQMIASTPLTTEKEKRDHALLTDKLDQLLRENRRKKVSECESWAAINKIITQQ